MVVASACQFWKLCRLLSSGWRYRIALKLGFSNHDRQSSKPELKDCRFIGRMNNIATNTCHITSLSGSTEI